MIDLTHAVDRLTHLLAAECAQRNEQWDKRKAAERERDEARAACARLSAEIVGLRLGLTERGTRIGINENAQQSFCGQRINVVNVQNTPGGI